MNLSLRLRNRILPVPSKPLLPMVLDPCTSFPANRQLLSGLLHSFCIPSTEVHIPTQ